MRVEPLANIQPRVQAFLAIALFFGGLFAAQAMKSAGLIWLWYGLHALLIAFLSAPSIARIIVEVRVEKQWFFSRVLPANLGGLALVFLVAAGTVEPLEDKNSLAPAVYAVLVLLLSALTMIFAISFIAGATGKAANRTLATRRLHNALAEKLNDGVLDEDEFVELEKLQEELGLDRRVLDEARTKSFRKAISPILSKVRSERRMSPEQEQELLQIASDHQVSPNLGSDLQVYRQLYDIDTTGEFTPTPIENPSIRLGKGEKCYLEIPAAWKQLKQFKKNTGYVGGSIGFRVAKGVTLRVGRAVPTYKEYEELQTKATGRLFLTDKKLVFVGDRQSTNITFGRLASYSLAKDAIEVNKTSGKPDVFFSDPTSIELLDAHLQVIG